MRSACYEMQLLVQADLDGELTPAEAARVAAHLERCPDCAKAQTDLQSLQHSLRRDLSYHSAPNALRAAILERLTATTTAEPARPMWHRLASRRFAPFGAGVALAASIAFIALLPRQDALPEALVSGHIRALQPGHLMDVVSTDQHTVKPWFDGRIDFAPPVKDTAAQGFPLAGGRLDYLAGHPVAVLVYQRRQHIIDLFIWQETRSAPAVLTARNGYNMRHWQQDGMTFWAVSDLNDQELAEFAQRWQSL